MRMNVNLQDKDGNVRHKGQVDVDLIDKAHLVTYEGVTYAYFHVPTPSGSKFREWVLTANFRECESSVCLDGQFHHCDEGI